MTHDEPTAPIPAVIYAAKSTEDKHGSIPTQLADCRVMAEREGWEVVGVFQDEGVSAYSRNRGAGLEAAKQAVSGAVTGAGRAVLLAQHSDRVARGAGNAPGAADHLSEVVAWLTRQGATLRTVQDDFYGDQRIAPVMGALMGMRNSEDSQRNSEATRDGKRRRFERGDSAGPLPFGYLLVPRSGGEGKVRVPHPEEAPIVRHMFEMLDEGRGIGEITRWVNAQGVRTTRGNSFGRSRVREILRNPWYGGKVRGYGELRDGNHEHLLPWEEFERIAARLDAGLPPAASRGGRPSNDPALLSGVLRCAHCGHGVWQRRGKRRRYVCGNVRHATGVCDAAPFDAALVEEAVVEHLSMLFLDFDGWLRGVTEHRAAQREVIVRKVVVANDRFAALTHDEDLVRADYMKHLRAGKESAADLATAEIERIEKERAELAEAVGNLEAQLAEWDDRNTANDMLDWWSDLSAAIRGEVVNAASAREANSALRERFAAIFVRSPHGGSPRLDFVLREREPGAPLVSSRLWADDPSELPEEGWLIDFIQESPPDERSLARPPETSRLTLV